MSKTAVVIVDQDLAVQHAELLARVNALDLGHVVRALIGRDGLSEAEAEDAVKEYRAWRLIQAMHADRTVLITERADKAWHWDILHTEAYIAGCGAVEGRYVHHRPGLSESAITDNWAATVALFRDVAGIDLSLPMTATVGNCFRQPAECMSVANSAQRPSEVAAA